MCSSDLAPVVADRAVIDTMPLDPEDLPAAVQSPRIMPPEEQLSLVEAFIDRWHDPRGRLHGAIGPSGPQRCSDHLLELSGDLSRRRGVIWHSHVLETKAQKAMGLRLYGESMVRHLDRLGLLTPRTNLVHLIWAEPDDLDVVARAAALFDERTREIGDVAFEAAGETGEAREARGDAPVLKQRHRRDHVGRVLLARIADTNVLELVDATLEPDLDLCNRAAVRSHELAPRMGLSSHGADLVDSHTFSVGDLEYVRTDIKQALQIGRAHV